MLHTTFDLLRRAGACDAGYRKLAKSLGGITKYGRGTPIPLSAIIESNGLEDALWCLQATIEPSEALSRDIACDFADAVAPLVTDEICVAAIAVARRHARGQATDDDLSAARKDVCGVYGAAGVAARDTTLVPAWSAAWNAALDAERAVASDAFLGRLKARLAAHDPEMNPLGEVPEQMPCLVRSGGTPCAA